MERLSVNGLEELLHALGTRKEESKPIYLLFCGDVSKDTGESWCSDCVTALPVVEKVVSQVQDGVLIHCSVGDRGTWKDPQNVFRKHPKLLLTGVPTLMQWGTAKRLGADECAKEDLVRMFFEED